MKKGFQDLCSILDRTQIIFETIQENFNLEYIKKDYSLEFVIKSPKEDTFGLLIFNNVGSPDEYAQACLVQILNGEDWKFLKFKDYHVPKKFSSWQELKMEIENFTKRVDYGELFEMCLCNECDIRYMDREYDYIMELE